MERTHEFTYSSSYFDDNYEYRQVVVSSEIGKMILEKGVMSEERWRQLGISMGKGWTNYTCYKLEPHIMLFRRPIGTIGATGLVDQNFRIQTLETNAAKRKELPNKFKK